MSIAVFLKNNLKNIPPSIGQIINRIPYSVRPGLGKIYKKRRQEISEQNTFDKRHFVFNLMKDIVKHSYANIPFYKNFYDENNFHPDDLTSFSDIDKIPIINKSI